MHHSDGKSLREELRLVERHGRGRPYPKDLRRRAAAFGVLRARQGAALHAIAQELGIADRTLARWLMASSSSFVAVEVTDEHRTAASHAIVVHGPRGIRIEGLDVAQVATLLRSLA